MRPRTTMYGVVLATVLLATAVQAAPASAAPTPVTHRTVFATGGGTLYRLALSSTGAVTARTAVAKGAGAVASDYDGRRLVFIRPGAADFVDDQVWVREASGGSRFLAMGHRATFTPDRTGVVIARHVATGPDALSVIRLADGHVTPLSPQRDGVFDRAMRNSRDGKSLWLLTILDEDDDTLTQYDRATDTITRRYDGFSGCSDLEILPSGANALLMCAGELLTVRLDTGTVTHRTSIPFDGAAHLDGRLNSSTLLLSVRGPAEQVLASLDLTTMRMRTLPGSAGYAEAVTAY